MTASGVRKLVGLWLVPYVAIVAYFIFTDQDRMPKWVYPVPLCYFVGGLALLCLIVSRAKFSAEEKQRAANVLAQNAKLWRGMMVGYAFAFVAGIVMLIGRIVPLLYGSIAAGVVVVLFLLNWSIYRRARAVGSDH